MGFFGFGSKSKNTSQAYDKKTGSDYSGIYKNPKSSAGSNFLMDIGVKQKTSTYYSELPSRQAKSRAMAEAALSNKSDDGPGLSSAASRPRQLTAAELRAQRKAAELAKRRTEGQAARKKFEKEKGEKRIARRKKYMKLLNV